jgi:hypothetical protein
VRPVGRRPGVVGALSVAVEGVAAAATGAGAGDSPNTSASFGPTEYVNISKSVSVANVDDLQNVGKRSIYQRRPLQPNAKIVLRQS